MRVFLALLILRDPEDHQGTEWLHARILQAKVAIERDPAWLEAHSVLGVDFGSEVHPRMPALHEDRFGRPSSLEEIEKAIDYQLRERLKFVTAPDPIVANLYRARADIAYLQKSRLASDYYLAAGFFGANDDLTKRREQQFRIEYPPQDSRSEALGLGSVAMWAMVATVATLLLLVAGFTFRFVRKPSAVTNKSL